MFKRIVLVSVLSMFSVAIFGQEKITLKVEKLSDFQPQSPFRTNNQVGYLFKVGDGEYEAVGYKGERLEEILKTDEAAYKEFKRFKRKATIGKVGYWIGGIALASLPILYEEGGTESQTITAIIITGVVGVGSAWTFAILHRKSPKHIENAVAIYNQNL